MKNLIKIKMPNLALAALLIINCQLSIAVAAQTFMNVYISDGSVVQIDISTIDSITYEIMTPGTLATITTTGVTGISGPSAMSGGNITATGGSTISHRGVCWATTTSPTTANDTTLDGTGTGTGSYTSTLTGLSANTTYYVRAYAINSAGTSYGNEVSFTTGDIYTMGSGVTDIDGNTYTSIILGTQEWMQQNLRVTRFANGDSIANVSISIWGSADSLPQRTSHPGFTADPYGLVYNVYVVKDLRNVCPSGWHNPSTAEWNTLSLYLDPTFSLGNGSETVTRMLADSTRWLNSFGNNISGFSAVGTGPGVDGGSPKPDAYWWTSSVLDSVSNYSRKIFGVPFLNAIRLTEEYGNYYDGHSIRCLKN